MEVSWEFYKELWQEHHRIFGLKEQSLKIVQLLQQGNGVLVLILECFGFTNFDFVLRLKQHVSDPKNPPILIFPEGTCINNTSVMQFKKGSFEVGGVIYPVAIK